MKNQSDDRIIQNMTDLISERSFEENFSLMKKLMISLLEDENLTSQQLKDYMKRIFCSGPNPEDQEKEESDSSSPAENPPPVVGQTYYMSEEEMKLLRENMGRSDESS